MSDPPFEGPVRWEIPPMTAFYLSGDEDGLVWLQCSRCLETWDIGTLGEGVERWNTHTCLPRN